jgi:hypothetical protein
MMAFQDMGMRPKQLLFNDRNLYQPVAGSEEEYQQFKKNQQQFTEQFESFFPDNLAPKTIVVIPSLTLDQAALGKIKGILHYEERMLCLLMLLRMPRTHVIYVSSTPIDPVIIDYYLHLLPGITGFHARERLTLLSCYDTSSLSLTEKILQRPRLIERIKQGIPPHHLAHIAFFNSSPFEKTLAVQLGLPIYGCDPTFNYIGTKSGGRKAFIQAGVAMPAGEEDVKNIGEIIKALVRLKEKDPYLKKASIKLNDGFSGDGNALLEYPDDVALKDLSNWLQQHLIHQIVPIAPNLSTETFLEKFQLMEGIVEAFIEGQEKVSPSVQCRINPLGEVEIISTHDQVMSQVDGQVFTGAHFPANDAYSIEIGVLGKKIASTLKSLGVLGRFSIDFISVKEKDAWKHYALEINLRKGGTTHPFLMLQFLTNGHYNENTGAFETAAQQPRYYFSSDNLQHDAYKGLAPQDLINIAMFHGLHFDGASQTGVIFHMIGALSQYGKMGIVCIGTTPHEAFLFYKRTIEVLDAETGIP